ncbi:MAG: dephospho-CoA kinase, partial [candidate division Zixibacteria bacterium]|nr:dephospho-CoA kinase [candidate division Zixibacteria bacterium]
ELAGGEVVIIGLTGLMGSGKSEVAAVFAEMGAVYISADAIGRQVLETDSVVFYRLLTAFGVSILNRNLTLNRKLLGRLAFLSLANAAKLNEIVHPPLLKRLDMEMARTRRQGRHAVVDAALLVQWRYDKRVDCTVLVTSSERRRYRRLVNRGFDPEEIHQRLQSQLPVSELRRHADYVITNNGDLATLRKKAKKLYSRLTGGC